MGKPRCVIYDLDGTVADSSLRAAKHIDLEAKRAGDLAKFRASLDGYSLTCEGDVTIPAGIMVVSGLCQSFEAVPVALTSRGNYGRIPTLAWLQAWMPWEVTDENLVMRPEAAEVTSGDSILNWVCTAAAEEYKSFRLAEIQERYTVVAAVDDHLGVCEMYQANGVPAIHVLYPGIDCLTPGGEHITLPAAYSPFTMPSAYGAPSLRLRYFQDSEKTGARAVDKVGPIW